MKIRSTKVSFGQKPGPFPFRGFSAFSFPALLHPVFVALALLLPGYTFSQDLKASFETLSTFHRKGTGHKGEIQSRASEVAWKGERISEPFLLWAEGDMINNIRFSISEFRSERDSIAEGSASIKCIEYVLADPVSKACGEYSGRDKGEFIELGDVLSTSLVTSIHPDTPRLFWFAVDIPRSTEPGNYTGRITIMADETRELVLEVIIRVVDLVLPQSSEWSFHLDLWQYPSSVADRYNESNPRERIDYWSAEHFAILKKQYRILADAGQKVITAHIKEGALGSASMIKWIKRPEGNWAYDYTAFDTYVDSLTAWGIASQISCQSPVGWNEEIIPYWNEKEMSMMDLTAPPGSENYAERWDHFLNDFKVHLDSKGWFNKTVLYLDEVEAEQLSWIIRFIKNNHPAWKIGLAAFHTPSDFVDSSVFDLSLMIGTEGNPARSIQDKKSTFYTSCNPVRPNNFVAGDALLAENIWMGWHAQREEYDGFLRWGYDYWKEFEPFEQRAGGHTSGDFSFSYRSSNDLDMEIYSSLRLALIREGIEDYEKVKILKSQLKDSDKPGDSSAYDLLMSKLQEFTASSGSSGSVTLLVESARKLLEDIVINP